MTENYETVKELGRGRFGEVLKVERISDKTHFAMKKVKIKNCCSERECETVMACKHPYIIKYFEMFTEKEYLYFIMELCDIDLYDFIHEIYRNGAPEIWVLTWTFQLGLALEYIHFNNLVHKDIKEQNILLVDGKDCKLSDFGLMRHDNSQHSTNQGSYMFQSPELLKDMLQYTKENDMWSFGCVVHFMCSCQNPFGKNLLEFFENITKERRPPRISGESYSQELQDIIDGLLCHDVNSRLSADQLLSSKCFACNHNDWDVTVPRSQLFRVFQKTTNRKENETFEVEETVLESNNKEKDEVYQVQESDLKLGGESEFTYSSHLEQRAETETFGIWQLKGIRCCSLGKYELDWSTMGGDVDWLNGWRLMVNGKFDRRGLWSFLFLPQQGNESLIWIDVGKSENDFVVRCVYADEEFSCNRPPSLDIQYHIHLSFVTKNGLKILESREFQEEKISNSKCELLRLPSFQWKALDSKVLPVLVLHLLRISR